MSEKLSIMGTQAPENKPSLPAESLTSSDKTQENENFPHKEVRKYARKYFEDIYSQGTMNDLEVSFIAQDETQHELSVLSDCEKEWTEERRYSDNFREATNIFLEELVVFVEENEDDERIDKFLHIIQQMFFSSSPSLSSALDFRQHFDFSAKVTRVKRLQPVMGGSVIGDLAYKIGWNYNPDAKDDELLRSYNESSIPEKLDKLNITEMLGAELIGAGKAYNHGDKKLIKMLSKIKIENKNAFIGYAIDIVENRLGQENMAPSRGLIQYSNDPGNARLRDSLTEEEMKSSGKLKNIIKPNRPLRRGENLVQIADDVVAIVDHSKLPIEYSRINLEGAEEHQSKVTGTFLVALKDAFNKRNNEGIDIALDKVINLSNKNIFIPRDDIEDSDSKKLAAIWERFGNTPKERWEEYFELHTFVNGLRDKIKEFEEAEKKKTGEINFKETLRVFDTYKREVPSILNYVDKSATNEAYEEFIKAYESGDYEYAFDQLNRISIGLRFKNGSLLKPFGDAKSDNEDKGSMHGKVKSLIEEFTKLRSTQTAYWNEYRATVNNYHRELVEKFGKKLNKFDVIAGKIEEDKKNIFSALENELDLIIDKEGGGKREAEFVDFNSLVKSEGDILKGLNTKDAKLLFQHLYRPAMKQKIEEEFGIRFNKLSFRDHVHFLKFLSERGQKEVEKVKDFLGQADSEVDKKNRIKAFLSLESGELSGEDILGIGNLLDKNVAEQVFQKFNEVALLAQQSNEELSQEFFKGDEVIEPTEEILKRASRILVNFDEKIKKTKYSKLNREEKREVNQKLLDELVKIKSDIIFFSSMFKTAYKGEKFVDFEEVKGLDFQTITSAELSLDEKKEILEISAENYSKNVDQQEDVKNGILKSFENKDKTQWYLLKRESDGTKKQKIITCMRFDKLDENSVYAGSFNVSRDFRGSALGGAMYNNVIEGLARFNKIKAVAEVDKQATAFYLKNGGFVVEDVFTNNKTGIDYFNITRDDKNNNKYKTRSSEMSEKDMLEKYYKEGTDITSAVYNEDIFVVELEQNFELSGKSFKAIIDADYVITRIIATKNKTSNYYVFEKKVDSAVAALN